MQTRDEVTVFVSKYALSGGIIEKSGCICADGGFYVEGSWGGFRKGEWHFTRAEAVKAAEKMRDKRIASLKKQIADLVSMEF